MPRARETGVSESTVGRIWATHGLKPPQVKTFKLSNDQSFEEKPEDIVGPYLSPPEHAIVLSCDEKSQNHALDRTQPGLPLQPGRCLRGALLTLSFPACSASDGDSASLNDRITGDGRGPLLHDTLLDPRPDGKNRLMFRP